MIVDLASIAYNLRPGLAAECGLYKDYNGEFKEIFTTYKSDKHEELEVENKFLGAAAIRPDGSPTAQSDIANRYITSYISQTISIGFSMTRQAIEDNLYKDKLPQSTAALRRSMGITKDVLGAAILNNAFNPLYPIADGQPICGIHPIDGGSYNNTPTDPVALSEAGLEQGIIDIQLFRDLAGLLTKTIPLKLIVPTQQQWTAQRILASMYKNDTDTNAVSALYTLSAIPQGYRVNHYLTNPKAYFLLTDAPDGFKHYERIGLQMDSYCDFDTDTVKVKATERYCFGITNARGVWGSPGL